MNENNENLLKRLKFNSSPQPSALSTPSTTNTSQWKDLPTLEIVLNYLPIKTFKELSLVCKNWNKLTLSHRFESIKTFTKPNEAGIWKTEKQPLPESEIKEHILNISKYSKFITSLTINQMLVNNNLSLIFKNFSNLTKLLLDNIIISPVSLDIIASGSQRLEHLTLDNVEIGDTDWSKFFNVVPIVFCETLKYLSFKNTKSNFQSYSKNIFSLLYSKVQVLEFYRSDEYFLSPFITNYPELKHFDFTNYQDPKTRNMATKILENNPQITHLTFFDNHLNEKMCGLIFNHFSNLEYLNVGAKKVNTKFTIQEEAIQNLRVLDLGNYEDKSAHLALTLLPHCSNLTKLKIFVKYETRKLMDLIATQCPNLTELIVSCNMIKFGGRKNFFPWTSHVVDADLWDRTFLCAENLQRLTIHNILLTGLDHGQLEQFKRLKTAEFEIDMVCGIDYVARELKQFLDSLLDFTSYYDYKGSVKGSIHIRDTIE